MRHAAMMTCHRMTIVCRIVFHVLRIMAIRHFLHTRAARITTIKRMRRGGITADRDCQDKDVKYPAHAANLASMPPSDNHTGCNKA